MEMGRLQGAAHRREETSGSNVTWVGWEASCKRRGVDSAAAFQLSLFLLLSSLFPVPSSRVHATSFLPRRFSSPLLVPC